MKPTSHKFGFRFILLLFFFFLSFSYVSVNSQEFVEAAGKIAVEKGKRTENAIKDFQKDNSIPVTGEIDSIINIKLGLIPEKFAAPEKEITAKPSIDLLLLGGLLTVALYNFLLFWLRVKGISMLYLGALCVLIAFPSMQSAGIALLPNFDPETALKFEFMSVCLFFTIFVMLIENLYTLEFSRKVLRVSQTLGVLFAISAFVVSSEIRAHGIMAFGGIVSVITIYLFYVLTRAVIKKRDGAILFLVGSLFLFTIFSYGIFYDQVIFKSELVPLGVFIVLFSQSFAVSMRFSKPSNREIVYERFVPKKFLTSLGIDDIADVKLGDNIQQEMSILFSDIRNFTTLSERMTPEENFRFINSYLSVVGPVIRRHDGFIDKYIGDAIMALFGKTPNDALDGALDMLGHLSEYNEGRKRAGYIPIKIGIGINTGILRIGTIGERDRMEGTVISDAVNVSSRIEGMTKVYGTPLLISDETYRLLKDPSKYHIRKIDRVKVKGKTEAVTLWEVFDGDPPDLLNYKLDIATMFEYARSLYQSRKFEEANEMFLDLLARNKHDKVAEVYRERCKLYLKMGVDDNPDGVVRNITYERLTEL